MGRVKFFFEEELSLDQIKETFVKAFYQNFDCEYWKWRFLLNPNDTKIYIGFILENNTLASYYAVSPSLIQIEGIKYKIGLSNMGMTHPDHQGKGYFRQIVEGLHGKLIENGFIGVYGFANSNSHYGFREFLNWQDLSILNKFQLNRNTLRYSNKDILGQYIFEYNEIDENQLEIINKMMTNVSLIHLTREKREIRWRLMKNPKNKYFALNIIKDNDIIASLIYKYYNGEIDIMEFFTDNNYYHIKNKIIGAGIYKLVSEKAERLNIWSNLYSSEYLYLEKIGFKEKEFSTYFGVIPFEENDLLLQIKNWHYRFFDSDIY
jgi:hypothetical protein